MNAANKWKKFFMATMGNVLIGRQDKYNMCVSVNILMMSITIVLLMLRSRKTMILSTVRKKRTCFLNHNESIWFKESKSNHSYCK